MLLDMSLLEEPIAKLLCHTIRLYVGDGRLCDD